VELERIVEEMQYKISSKQCEIHIFQKFTSESTSSYNSVVAIGLLALQSKTCL